MSKRRADSDLNHENWDRDEDPEDAGQFQTAPENVLSQRIIRTAKRRSNNDEEEGQGEGGERADGSAVVEQGGQNVANVFSTFTGFSNDESPPAPSFDFILSNSEDAEANNNVQVLDIEGNVAYGANTVQTTGGYDLNVGFDAERENYEEYLRKLKELNESFLAWVQTYILENPLIDLQPIFLDYTRHMDELNQNITNTKETLLFSFPNDAAVQVVPLSNIIDTPKELPATPLYTSPTATCSYLSEPSTSKAAAAATLAAFSFKPFNDSGNGTFSSFPGPSQTVVEEVTTTETPSNHSSPKTFTILENLPSSTGSSDASSSLANGNTNNSTENESSDEPPQEEEEVRQFVEEGAVYTTRCKVFIRNNGDFSDRGIGNLYLKPIPDSEKYQLIVRANTTLANILCNIVLTAGIPMQRMGKRDVMLVYVPSVPERGEEKVVPLTTLLRAKSPEDADALLKVLESYKK